MAALQPESADQRNALAARHVQHTTLCYANSSILGPNMATEICLHHIETMPILLHPNSEPRTISL